MESTITPKVILWTSEVVINILSKFSYDVIMYNVPAFCSFLVHLEISENGAQHATFVCNEIVSLGAIFNDVVFP